MKWIQYRQCEEILDTAMGTQWYVGEMEATSTLTWNHHLEDIH